MFTWKFPAGTGTFESDIVQVDGSLIRVLSAALAVSPYGAFTAGEQDPFPRNGQSFTGLYRGGIRGELYDLFFS